MGVSRKQSTPKFPKNNYFLPPDTHTYVCVSGGKKCLFFGNFGVLCFLETPVLRFALLPYYRRYIGSYFGQENQINKNLNNNVSVFFILYTVSSKLTMQILMKR